MAAALLAAGPAAGATWYVNGSCGNNGWGGLSAVCAGPNGPKATIQAGINAASDGDEVVVADGTYTGTGNRNLSFGGRQIVLRSAGGSESCIIDCQGAGGFEVVGDETTETVIEGFTITNGYAYRGGGISMSNASLTVRDCIFANNSAGIGAVIDHRDSGDLILEGCTFIGNTADKAAGAVFSFATSFTAIGCEFRENGGELAIGALGLDVDTGAIINCAFEGNFGEFTGGAIASSSGGLTLINCVFSRNTAAMTGGADLAGNPSWTATVSSCTFSNNVGEALTLGAPSTNVANGIFWGNTVQIATLYSHPVTSCDVQGGWPGDGNIDADPLFVQPGLDDVRLAEGSPCIDAGDNGALPADAYDLDGDGDTSEPSPVDVAGGPRVQRGIVDMGAYEGAGQAQAPADGVEDLDPGEFAFLIPDGDTYDPLQHSTALLVNTAGPPDASFTLTQYDWTVHPEGLGFSELGAVLQSETTMADGQFFLRLYVPFDASMLAGADPMSVTVTYFDPVARNWALAVAGNTADSPGHALPIGDRIMVEGTDGNWGVTWDLGDYGVFWNPDLGQGFGWANVDFVMDAGVGAALCPGDCVQTPDGLVGVQDLFAVLAVLAGGPGPGSCDVTLDGVVDVHDILFMLDQWGPCAAPALARSVRRPMVRPADVDGSGAVDREDVLALRDAWGPCGPDCAADLDADGDVDVTDLLGLLAGRNEDGPHSRPYRRSPRR